MLKHVTAVFEMAPQTVFAVFPTSLLPDQTAHAMS